MVLAVAQAMAGMALAVAVGRGIGRGAGTLATVTAAVAAAVTVVGAAVADVISTPYGHTPRSGTARLLPRPLCPRCPRGRLRNPDQSAGHVPAGTEADNEPTFQPDHSVGLVNPCRLRSRHATRSPRAG